MDLQYLVREPADLNPKTPALFMLHGYGSNENDLFSFLPTLPENWLVVSYRAPFATPFEGHSWYDIDFNNPDKFVDTDQAQESLAALISSIMEVTNRYQLLDNETHLCGFSQGGVLCYTLALKYPELFHKIACLSAYPEPKLLTGAVTDKKRLEHLRFFISHGTDDAVIPLEWGRKAADLLYDFNCYFTFREYMSGHGVNQKNYLDLMEFFKK